MIVSHYRGQVEERLLSIAFFLLKEGIQAEKLENIVTKRRIKSNRSCFLAMKLNAEHRKRQTSKKLIKFLSKSKIISLSSLDTANCDDLLYRASHASNAVGLASANFVRLDR